MSSKKSSKKNKKQSLEEKAKESPTTPAPGRSWLIYQYDKDGYPVLPPPYKRGSIIHDNYSSDRDDTVEEFYRID